MKRPLITRPFRLVALVAALGAGAMSVSACDASPYAATVDGHTISQLTLNNQLKDWSSNRTWVTSFDSANSQQSGGSGTTVVGSGGPGTYSSTFVADILANMIQVSIIHQHLAATGNQPAGDEVIASRAVNELLRSNYWDGFSPSLRQFLVDQLAEQAPLTPVSTNAAALKSAYSQIQPYLFSEVCMRQAAAFSKSDAERIISSGSLTGTQVCYDQASLEAQPRGFQTAVAKLHVGQTSQPIPTSYGFQVVKLTTRQSPGFSKGVQRVLSVAIASTEPASVTKLIDSAHVKVNPAYGTWAKGTITPPHVASS